MKYLLTLFVAVSLFIAGCSGQNVIGVKPLDPFSPPPVERPCTIYADNGITSGLIFENIKNPCAAQNILIFIAQGGYSLESYQFEEFKLWVGKIKAIINDGVSYTGLRALILKIVMEQNKKMGMLLFSASGLIDMFQGSSLLDPNDAKLCQLSLDDLVTKVELLTVFD